ncbi:glycosyltransferase family 4 protein [Chloroflexota bacterium]
MRILISSIIDLEKVAHNRLHEFIKYLIPNHEITVLSINDSWKANQSSSTLANKELEKIFQSININYITKRKTSPILQELASKLFLPRILARINYKTFDVHLNYNTLISGYLIAKELKSIGICTVYDIADDLPAMVRTSPQIPFVLRPLGGFIADIMIKKNISLAHRVTFTTSSLKDHYHLGNKAIHIPNGVDAEMFKREPSEQLREELDIKHSFIIGYVGVLREWMDFEPIFAAVKQLIKEYTDIKILIVGEEGGLEKNKALARRYGLSDKVIFIGTITYSRVSQYISCMDICLIPHKINSVSEKMLPLKMFEYMACEKPVISAGSAGVKEAVQDRVLYASSKEEYQDQITLLYDNKELREKMGLEGRQFAGKYYSWSCAALELETVLIEAAGEPLKR